MNRPRESNGRLSPIPIEERFWEKVDKNGPVLRQELGACWVWIGAKTRGGYGNVRLHNPRCNRRAHRVAFFLTFGKLPNNNAAHRCDNPSCVRPSHLFDATDRENTMDMINKGRNNPNPLRGDDHPTRVLSSADIPVILARRKMENYYVKSPMITA